MSTTSAPAPISEGLRRRFLNWLSLLAVLSAVAMGVLLTLVWRQSRSLEEAAALRADSLTALVFQFEREYGRLRDELTSAVYDRGPFDGDAIALRYDIFVSRVTLLQENSTISLIRDREEYSALMPHVTALLQRSDPVFAKPPLDRQALRAVLSELNALEKPVGALSYAATSVISSIIEGQMQTMRVQNQQLMGLALALLVILLASAAALTVRQRRQTQERLALREINHHLREAEEAAASANRGKTLFLANMSHELRTPFNGMMGMLNLLEGTTLDAHQHDLVVTARASAQHLLSLLNDILDVSSMEAGKLKLNLEAMDLHRLVADVDQLMRQPALAKGLGFQVDLDPQLPVWVHSDPTRFRQILFNLVNNAIKFTASGHVSLQARRRLRVDGGSEAVFTVTDTGIGMDANTLAQLFERFFQADLSTSRQFGGTGLGLEISRTLARMLGGDLTASSAVGQGSTFVLTVPLATCTPPAQATTPAGPQLTDIRPAAVSPPAALPVELAPPANAQAANGSPALRILVAEDHPINRKLITMLLQKMGHGATLTENGQEALDALGREPYDLLLTDVHMPVMDGLEATRAIRAMPPPLSQLPIIAITADVVAEARERALAAGVDAFVTKPIQMAELQRAMDGCLPRVPVPQTTTGSGSSQMPKRS